MTPTDRPITVVAKAHDDLNDRVETLYQMVDYLEMRSEKYSQSISQLDMMINQHGGLTGESDPCTRDNPQNRQRALDGYSREISLESSDKRLCFNAYDRIGDCVTDANLYQKGARHDNSVFYTLYSLSWARVLHLCKSSFIPIL